MGPIPFLALVLLAWVSDPAARPSPPQSPAGEPVMERRTVLGRVLGPDDAPLARANVWFYRVEDVARGGASDEPLYQPPFRLPHPTDAGARLVYHTATSSDEHGAFAIDLLRSPGAAVRDEWFADATFRGLVSRGVRRVDAGALDFRMERPGRIRGRVVIDLALGSPLFLVEVDGRPAYIEPDGRFEIDGIAPGVREVRFLVGFDDEPLARIADVTVESGMDAIDARLARVDLRGLARELILEAVDPAGKPINGFMACPLDSRRPILATTQTSVLRVPTALEHLDVAVCGYPSRVRRIEGAIGYCRVVLEPPIEIDVALAGGAVLPPPPLMLQPVVEHAEPARPQLVFASLAPYLEVSPVNAERRARVQLAEAGAYRVGWALLSGPHHAASRNQVVSEWVPIHALDAWSPQVIPVALDPQALERALLRR